MKTSLLEAVRRGFKPADEEPAWVLVIGDLMLDQYLWGQVERISPEAPVPVVLLDNESNRPGGAANVAANIADLGLDCRLLGCVGADDAALRLINIVKQCGIKADSIVTLPDCPTITKTRIVGGHQQMLRVDRESRAPYSAEQLQQLDIAIREALRDEPAIIILSDYAKGVLSTEICRLVIDLARVSGIPVLVDPKGRDYSKYHGATALTPNRREIFDACGGDNDIAALPAVADELLKKLALEFLAVTRSEEGISLIEPDQHTHIPAMAKQVFDVSGAGDTVIATLAAGMVAGLSHAEAIYLANLAAGIVVAQIGTVTITGNQLLAKLASEEIREQADKMCDLSRLQLNVADWRAAGERIVFTNGCFDLLHAGHVTYLEAARKLGERLIVGLNTDASVHRLKGDNRPVIHEADRARVLVALESVDAVVLFDEDTPLPLIRAIRPDVLVKGDDYHEEQVVGGVEVKSWGGTVVLIPVVPGRSTTAMIRRMEDPSPT